MRILLAFIILFQHLFLYGCNFSNQSNNNDFIFSKKSIPDINVCNDPSTVNISVSKTKLSKLPKNPKDYITITTNIPDKLVKLKEFYNSSNIDLLKYYEYYYGGRPSLASFSLNISKKGTTSFFEKTLQDGCTSFDWDGTDNKGNFLEFGIYDIQIFFTYIFNGTVIKRPIVTSDFFRFDNYNSYYSSGTYYGYAPYYDYTIAPAAWYCSDILTMLRYCPQGYPSRPFFTQEEEKKQIDHTNIELVETQDPEPLDPATTRFFEVEDFKKLSDYANQLNISDDMADALYTKIKGLEILETQKISLLARNTPPIAKIQEIDNKIAEINAVITSLQSGLMVALSDISNKNNVLVNQVNSITQTQYITPYPPEEKPTSVGGYFDSAYFADQDLSNILTDGVTLYSPDPDDPIQDDLKEAWQVSPERVEVNDPSQVFDGSKYITNEIQTAKDLMTDYLNGVFDASGNNGASEKSEAISVLKDLVTQIKNHTGLLKTKSKIYHDDLSSNFEKLKEAEAEQFQSIILPLANAMEQEGEYADDTYIRKVQSMTIQSFKTMDFKAWQDWSKIKYNIGKDFWNSNLGKREKVIAIVLGYTLDDWNALKKQDPKAADELVTATSELIEAVGIPTSYTSAAITLAGPVAKFTGKIGKIASNVLGKKLPPSQAGYIKKLLDNIKLTKEKVFRWIGKTPAKVIKNIPCFTGKAFYTQANIPCNLGLPILSDLATSYLKTTGKNLKRFYSSGIPASEVILKAGSIMKLKKSSFPNEWHKLYDEMGTVFNSFKNSSGIQVKKLKNYEIYFADFQPKSLGAVKIQNMVGDRANYFKVGSDYEKAAKQFIAQYPHLVPIGVTAEKFEEIRRKMGLIWHHHEDLQTMVLVDERIHKGVSHFGAVSIIGNIKDFGSILISNWKKIVVYE